MSGAREHYARVHEILSRAQGVRVEALDDFLAAECGGDTELEAEVRGLLGSADDEHIDDVFTDRSIQNIRTSLEHIVDDATSEWLPDKIGNYEIVRKIGQGGMGIVYEARQESPRRSVAIKLLHPIHATEDRLRRFRREAELLGRLEHRDIAQIFEAGTFDVGRGAQPFIAMELLQGDDIRTHCARFGLDRAARLELLARVADAVHHAHEHGVVHRDLKPENVLVDGQGNPRILDFGIARTIDDTTALSTALTEQGQLVGTLAYMAPEQLSGAPDEVTSHADIYSVGVLGFELLTSRLPREIADLPFAKAIDLLATTDPPRAGRLDPALRGDVETILGKALEHSPSERYPTAAALASDVRRHLADEPIRARAPSRTYLVRKFARRHKALVGGVLTTVVVAVAGAIVSTNLAIAATRRADALERANYLAGIAAASAAVEQQDYAGAAACLDGSPEAHRGWEYDYLRAQLVQHDAEWEAPTARLIATAFASDGRRMFGVLADGSICTWDTATGRLVAGRTIDLHESNHLALDPSTLRFAAALRDGSILLGNLATAEETRIEPGASGVAPIVRAWDHGGRRLLHGEPLRVWGGARPHVLSGTWSRGAFNRAGTRIALATGGKVVVVDTATGEQLCHRTFQDAVTDLEFSPDDERLAVAGHYRNAWMLDARTLGIEARLAGHQAQVPDLTWSPDGSRLITVSCDGTARVWNTRLLGVSTVFMTGLQLPCVAVTADGESFVVGGDSGRPVRRFPLQESGVLHGHESYVYDVTFAPDGSLLTSSGFREKGVRVWDVHRGRAVRRFPGPDPALGRSDATVAAISADGARLVIAGEFETFHRDIRTGKALPVTSNPNATARFLATLGRRIPHPRRVDAVSPDDKLVVTVLGKEPLVYHHPAITHPDAWHEATRKVTAHPDQHFQGGGEGHTLRHVRATPIARLVGHTGRAYCAAFSPDGARIATGGNDGTVRIWDAKTFEPLLVLAGHEQYVMNLEFSPDGTMLASASGDSTVRLWDTLRPAERRKRARR